MEQGVSKPRHIKFRSRKEDKNDILVTSKRQVLVPTVHRLLVFVLYQEKSSTQPLFVTGGIAPEREGFVVWDEVWDICGLV